MKRFVLSELARLLHSTTPTLATGFFELEDDPLTALRLARAAEDIEIPAEPPRP